MYKIYFYKDEKGNAPVLEYMVELSEKKDKDSSIKYNKILEYIGILSERGVLAGQPYLKHIEGNIWELRPIRDRIFFVSWVNNSYVLLHHFMKKTQKTPKKELEKAKKALSDIIKRGVTYE